MWANSFDLSMKTQFEIKNSGSYKCLEKPLTCMVLEVWSATDRIFCHSGPFIALLPTYGPKKLKFWKNEKNTWRYHFMNVYHKWQSYDVWFLRYKAWQNFLSFWTVFCHFTSLTTRKIKILKNWKKHLEILSFYTCAP